MNPLDSPGAATNGTSARGPFARAPSMGVVLIAGTLGFAPTSSHLEPRLPANVISLDANATSAGGAMGASADPSEPDQAETTAQAISTLRRMSGLTWDQLGRVFGVSRRAVHYWASGKPMSAEHEEHLRKALAVVRDRSGGADQVRSVLLSIVDGQQVLALLASQRFAEVDAALTSKLGAGTAPDARKRTSLSEAAEAARRPLPPEVLAAGEDDAVHPVTGRGRSVRTTRSRGRGQS